MKESGFDKYLNDRMKEPSFSDQFYGELQENYKENVKEICECCSIELEECRCHNLEAVKQEARAAALIDAINMAGKMNSTYDIIEMLKDLLRETT